MALAIRLNAERARLWQTNLAALLESLTGSRAGRRPRPTPTAGNCKHHQDDQPAPSALTRFLELARAGEWTVIGVGGETNVLAGEMLALMRARWPAVRPAAERVLAVTRTLTCGASPARCRCDWQLPAGLPRLTLSAIGDGGNVRTAGQLNFPKPLPFELEPWNIPTNLIHEPLVSFTAVQGVARGCRP